MSLAGVDEATASAALVAHETVEDAIEALLPAAPGASGDKYLPAKPTIDSGLSPDQEALCKKGRWLQDKVNAVFSVAHSKTRIQPDPLVLEASPEVPVSIPTVSEQTTSTDGQ